MKRHIEIFSAGCPACQETISLVNEMACPPCEITVRDMHDTTVAARAKQLGIHTVPAVVVDGELAECCADGGPNRDVLKQLGVGQPRVV